MLKYAECLAASDFGGEGIEGGAYTGGGGTVSIPPGGESSDNFSADVTSAASSASASSSVGVGMGVGMGVGIGVGMGGNIDVVVIPVLCNLTACAIQLRQWGKALQLR